MKCLLRYIFTNNLSPDFWKNIQQTYEKVKNKTWKKRILYAENKWFIQVRGPLRREALRLSIRPRAQEGLALG